MNIFRKIVAGIGAVLMSATLMGLPALTMAQEPGVTVAGIHSPVSAIVARAF